MEKSEISRRIELIKSRLVLLNHIPNGTNPRENQANRIHKQSLIKCIKSNIAAIPKLMYIPIYKVKLDIGGEIHIHHIANISENEIEEVFDFFSMVNGVSIKVLEIEKIPSQIRIT